MKALVYTDALKLYTAWADPQPADGEVLVAPTLAGICATDLEIVKGYMHFTGVLGHECVGHVVAGPSAWQGRRVVVEINCVCGTCEMCQAGLSNHCRRRTVLGIDGRDGVFAERVAVPERNLHAVPDAVSDRQAVFVEPLAAAFQVVKQCPVEKRTRVAVVGAGRLGLLVAQVLQQTGADLEVVGRNERSLAFCERHGIRATSVAEFSPRADKDLVVECSGSPAGFELAVRMLRPRGRLVLKSTYAGGAPIDLAPVVVHELHVVGSRCGPFADAIKALARGQIDVETMISREWPLDRGVEAIQAAGDPRYLKVLLTINAPTG